MPPRPAGILLAALLTVPTTYADSNWYASFGLGWNVTEDIKLGDTGALLESDFGMPRGTIAIGRQFGNNWRLELDGTYRETEMEILYFPATGQHIEPHRDDTSLSLSTQLSVIRDFQVGQALRPYFGAGLGAGHVRMIVQNSKVRPQVLILDDGAWALTWQIIAGFSVPITRQLDLGVDYRYWSVPSLKLTDEFGRDLDLKHSVHSGTLHLRYFFNEGPSAAIDSVDNSGHGIYLSGHLGMGYAVDAEIDDRKDNFDAFKVGPVLSLALGYDFPGRWRTELELTRRSNDIEIIDFGPLVGERRASGEVRANSLMANVAYRFRPGNAIRPLIGAGVGVADTDYDVTIPEGLYLDDKASGAAAQIILGIDMAVSSKLTVAADFRSWMAFGLKMHQPDGTALNTSHWVNSMSLGFRYSL